ncbi:hypothetical protein H6G89_14625 [Oscillatoria sp. FACHB-1407]|uniref:hypothetical protein n=1 Tax=Oscillatoria sp. FACHB-1407 TaxID=2692847 RepID=UPI0016824BC3|nr:hypothetical protein [Oscillatoria sp. FACHB-1407]MBD2462280.1 hypothetical protein [Oscillatoria sp. FACHB-1407]
MTHHDLTLEETGYNDARLQRSRASSNAHYLRGYRQGTRDHLTFQGFWEAHLLRTNPIEAQLSASDISPTSSKELTMTTTLELSTAELAERLGVTPRMVNMYRAAAERTAQRPLGTKRGKTKYFNAEEIELIRKAQILGATEGDRQQQKPADFTQQNTEAEAEICDGMSDIVAAGDRNALMMGRSLGKRWNDLMWTAALREMQTGMLTMQSQFNEMHASIATSLDADYLPQLTGNHSGTPQLEGVED